MVQTFFLSEIYIEISSMNRKVHDLEEMENTSHYHSIYIREMKMWHKYSPIWSTVFFIFILFLIKLGSVMEGMCTAIEGSVCLHPLKGEWMILSPRK